MQAVRVTLPLLALATLLATPAHAQSFSTLPNGETAFFTNLMTTGSFRCGLLYPVSCAASGNTLRLTSGASTLQLTYQGLNGPVTATNVQRPFTLGSIESVLTGSGFTFPNVNSNSQLFQLAIALSSTEPSGATQISFGFNSTGGPTISYNEGEASFSSLPTGGRYQILYQLPSITLAGRSGSTPLEGSIGLVPEPASMVMFGTGLIGVFGVSYRRRASSRL